MEYEFWEVRAEFIVQIPRWLDISITLLECDLKGVLPRD
jgi:hypothetical protein